MFFRHSADKLIYPLVALFILVLISYRPAYRLRTEMPQAFYPAKEPCGPKRPVEEKIACAYWDRALMNIQWKYPHEHSLPAEAPPEFRIDAPALGPLASDPATRQLYWHRLQGIWYVPEIWQQQYEWDWGWAHDPLGSGAQWLRETVDRFFTVK